MGSVIGLLTVGALAERTSSFGPAIALLSIAPILAALLILTRFPETASLELEELNPEDKAASEPEAAAAEAGSGHSSEVASSGAGSKM